MKQRLFLLFWVIVACVATAWAVPAKPGWYTHTQSDGKTVTVELVGDEFSSATLTRDGLMVYRAKDGDYYYYSSLTGRTTVRAHDEEFRTGTENTLIEAQKSQFQFNQNSCKSNLANSFRVGGSNAEAGIPATGDRTIPVILVYFKETDDESSINFQYTISEIRNKLFSGEKSLSQYFYDQSNGVYSPTFRVFGPYELSHERSFYGQHRDEANDAYPGLMVAEACQKAAADHVDFSQFSTITKDGQNYLDGVIILYAGVGENEAKTKHPEAIWPHQSTLDMRRDKANDGSGAFQPNGSGPFVNNYVAINEIRGEYDTYDILKPPLTGIGTMCHEFSHLLGLPDFYSTANGSGLTEEGYYYDENNYGMGSWSLMDAGCYNDDGNTPIGYNAYEKKFMRWINDYTYASDGNYYTLPIWNQGEKVTDKAICIQSDVNSNEYFILENRRKNNKWDKYIPDKGGILITHVTFVKKAWEANMVNYYRDAQLLTIVPADNKLDDDTEDRDLWPKKNQNSFTDDSTPAARLYLSKSGDISNLSDIINSVITFLGKPITEIVINSDNTASFWFRKGMAKTLEVNPKKINFGSIPCGTTSSVPVTVKGRNIEGNISISIEQTPAHWPQEFSANESSMVCTPEGVTFNVTYKPPQFATPTESTHTGFLRIQAGDDLISVPLSGSCYINNDEDGDGLFDIYDITAAIDIALQSGEIGINDITGMIDDLLNGETTIDLGNSLIAHYPLDGNTNDESGNGNNGIGYNISYTKGVTGDNNGACYFGGVDNPGYIKVPNSESLKLTDGFTFSCYFKPMGWKGKNMSSTVVDYGSHCIFAKSGNTTGPTLLFKGSADGLRTWSEASGTQNQWANIDSEDLLPNGNYLNKWVHVAITYSKTKKQARLYVNGILIKQKYVTTDIDFTQMNGKDLYLGQFLGSSMMNPMNGALDEVRLYNRYMGPTEIYNLSVQFKKDLRVRLSATEVVMNVGDVVKVDIINGGGNYSVGSTPEVVDFQLSGESIILTGMSEGATNVTFIDLESDTYILLPVTVNKAVKNYTVNGVTFTMIPVPGGTFTMGATEEQGTDATANEKPAHEVTLSNYLIGQTEVTQALWLAVMGTNPSNFTGDLSRPVELVSWEDCQQFISRLNALTGESFRLPTEAEWEYAARGDGVSVHYKYAGGNKISEVAWWGCGFDEDSPLGNSAYTTHPVGLKKPNELGLYDMSGNVYEWCYDWYGSYSSASQTNPTGPASGTNRVSRGGGWGYGDVNCRVSHRMGSSPTLRHPCQGLRLAL